MSVPPANPRRDTPPDYPRLKPSCLRTSVRDRVVRTPFRRPGAALPGGGFEAVAGPVDSHVEASDDKDVKCRARSRPPPPGLSRPTSARAVMGSSDRE